VKTGNKPGWQSDLLVLLCFAFLGIALYAQTLSYDFINWDDLAYIKDNIYIRRFSWHNISALFSSLYIGEWFPIQLLSYAVDYSFWGLNPEGYHLGNIVIHILNAFLIFVIVRMLCEGEQWVGLMSGLLFLVHPVHVESVVWMSQRKTVLCILFYLLSFITYIRWREGNKNIHYIASLAFFALSLLSKINSILFPLLLLTWELSLRKEKIKGSVQDASWVRNLFSILMPLIPFGLLSLGSVAIFLYGQITSKIIREFYGGTIYTNFLVSGAGFIFKYPNRLPFPIRLSAYYPRVDEYRSMFTLPYVLVVLPVWLTFCTLAFTSSRRNKRVFFFIMWFIITMFPTSGIVPAPFGGADRHLYLISIPVFALFAMGLFSLSRKYPLTIRTILITILVLISILTLDRSRVWRNSTVLWEDVASKSPQLPYAQYKLAQSYMDTGRLEEALVHIRSAISLDSSIALYHYTLGLIYRSTKDIPGALREFHLADGLEPGNSVLHREIAQTFEEIQEWEKAIMEYKISIDLDPNKAYTTMSNLGFLYINLKRYKEAVEQLERAITINPDFAEAHRSLGVLYVKLLGRRQKGLYHLRMSLKIDPSQPGAEVLNALIAQSAQQPSGL